MFFNNHTTHKDGSFVLIQSSVIKTKCEAMLTWIKAERERRVKQLIEETRQYMMSRFFHKLFRRPAPTDEEVRAYLESPDIIFPEIYFAEISFYQNEKVAKKLLNASKYVEEMYVSTEDLEKIS